MTEDHRKTSSTSWADESESLTEERVSAPSKPVNAWANGNPIVSAASQAQGYSLYDDSEYPTLERGGTQKKSAHIAASREPQPKNTSDRRDYYENKEEGRDVERRDFQGGYDRRGSERRGERRDAPYGGYPRDGGSRYGREGYETRGYPKSRDYEEPERGEGGRGYDAPREHGGYNRDGGSYKSGRGYSGGYGREGSYEESREGGGYGHGPREGREGSYGGSRDDREGGYGAPREGGYGAPREGRGRYGGPSSRPPRAAVPFPTEPPFTAFVGNLPYELKEEDIKEFFESEAGVKVSSVRLLMDKEQNKPKGFGYVEFEDAVSLKTALTKNGQSLIDRPLRIDVAESKPEEKRWDKLKDRRAPPPEESLPKEEETKERPKLQLKKPSETKLIVEPPPAEYSTAKVNPFGQAKPRDENLYLQKIEERKKRDQEVEPNVAEEKMESPTQAPQERKPSRELYKPPPRKDFDPKKDQQDRPPRRKEDWKKEKPSGEERKYSSKPRTNDSKDRPPRKEGFKKDGKREDKGKREDPTNAGKAPEEAGTEINENRFAYLPEEDE